MSSTMSTHVLRLTVRVHVGAFHREVDLSVPASSTLADALPEILELCGAPRITRPWRATTAAGQPLDQAEALHHAPLDHGSVLVLTPAEPVDAPIVRDSAEALAAEFGAGPGAHGAAQLAAVIGVATTVLLASVFLPWPAALAIGSGAAVLLLLWRRDAHLLAYAAIVAAALAAATYTSPSDWWASGWAVVAGTAAGLLLTLLGAALGLVGTRAGTAFLSTSLLLLCTAAGDLLPWLPAPTAPAAATVLGCLALLTLGPGLATRSAGLQVPALPTAGQDLTISDTAQPDVQDRARRAGDINDGLALGTATATAPALLALGSSGGLWAQLLCLTVAGAVLMHAARHRAALPGWSLTVIGLSACAGAVLAAVHEEPHPLRLGVAALITCATLSAVLWAPTVRDLAPTALAWWERTEFLAVLACLPLAVHLTGLFGMIRGLG